MHKEICIIVGGNGSGKSTFFAQFLAAKNLPFLNADIVAKTTWPDSPEEHSYEAAKLVEKERMLSLSVGRSFCYETVFSHPSKVDFIAQAKALGYCVNLFVIHINANPITNIARVSNRVMQGGHNVPEDKLRQRIPRMLDNVALATPLCDTVSFFDNTFADTPFSFVALLDKTRTLYHKKNLPSWVKNCVQNNYINTSELK